jgi:hypothetical protein
MIFFVVLIILTFLAQIVDGKEMMESNPKIENRNPKQ